MAKNLYIHTLKSDGNFTLDIQEDVKVTREGKIVKKRGADYNLRMGYYERKEDLGKCISFTSNVRRDGFVKQERYLVNVRYITFNENELSESIKDEMRSYFISEIDEDINNLKGEIFRLEELKNIFKG